MSISTLSTTNMLQRLNTNNSTIDRNGGTSMDKVHLVLSTEGGETEICGIYKQWSDAYEAAKILEEHEEYDSVEIEEWAVQ